MIQTFQTIYEGARLTRTPQKIRQIASIAGTIESITIEAQNVSLGDYVFNVKKNGVALFSGGSRITINPANKIVTKTGLDISVALGDLISFHLEEAAMAGLLPEIYFIVNIDDGIEAETDIAASVHAAAAKATPINADELAIVDSAASNALKKLSWQNLKATLKTYFDSLYQAVLVSGTNLKTINSQSLLGSGNISISGGGGSGSASSSIFSLDEKPFEDLHPLSDFFDGADAWTIFQGNYFKHSIESGTLKFIANPISGDAGCGLMKNLPAGNCTIIAKIDASYVAGGMALALFQDAAANPNTTDIIYFGLFNASGTVYLVPSRFTDFQTFGSNIYSNVDLTSATEVTGAVYVKMSRVDDNWSFSYSINGRKETSLGTAFSESSYFTPKQFGIITDNPNSLASNRTQITRCQFVYFFDRDGASLVGGRIGESRASAVENRVICIGDSITEGYGVSELKTYPHKLAETLDGVSLSAFGQVLTPDDESRTWKILNKGYSGYTTQKIIDRILPNVLLRRNSDLTRDVVVLFAGTNDANFGTSAATVYTNLSSIVGDLQAEGFEVFICTLIDRNDLGSGFDTFRAALNTMIAANAAGADGVIDLWADARLQNSADATYFQTDTVHPNAAGLAVIAELVEAAL